MTKFFNVAQFATVAIVVIGLAAAVNPAFAAETATPESWLAQRQAVLVQKLGAAISAVSVAAKAATIVIAKGY